MQGYSPLSVAKRALPAPTSSPCASSQCSPPLTLLRKSYAAPGGPEPPENWTLRAAGNALSAAITLGSGNSLGPEAPAATLGANVAFGLGQARPSGTDGRWTSRGLGTAELSGLRLTAGHLYVLMPGREAKRWVVLKWPGSCG